MLRYKIGFVLLLSIILVCNTFAQTNTKSPYSIYGIGDYDPIANATQMSMADVKYGVAFPYSINPANTATFGVVNQTTFDVGVKLNFLTLSTNNLKQKTYNSYLKNINFVFPVSKRLGFGFGLVPYTNMGYKIEDSETISGLGDVTYSYEGWGGINKAYMGTAVNLLRDSVQHLSIGITGAYMFGNLSKQRDIVIDDYTAYRSRFENEALLYGFNFDASLFYKRKIGKNILSMGGVYGLGTSIKTYTKELAYTYALSGGASIIYLDTAVYALDTGVTQLPIKIGVGLSYNFKQKLTVAVDYSLVDWTTYTFMGRSEEFAKRQQYAVGIQYIPDYSAISSIKKIIRYRAGFRYMDSRLVVNNTNLKEFGMTFGIGVPIIKSQSTSMINIGLEYGQRGTEKNSLTKEQFTNIIIGFSLTPHKFDRWFVKRKID